MGLALIAGASALLAWRNHLATEKSDKARCARAFVASQFAGARPSNDEVDGQPRVKIGHL